MLFVLWIFIPVATHIKFLSVSYCFVLGVIEHNSFALNGCFTNFSSCCVLNCWNCLNLIRIVLPALYLHTRFSEFEDLEVKKLFGYEPYWFGK